MSKVRNNVVVRGSCGMLGKQVVLRIDKAGRTILANRPTYPENRVFTPAQLAHQEKFRQARAYAKEAKTLAAYQQKAEGTPLTPSNVAMSDWFHAPRIQTVDLAHYTGLVGDTIRVVAQDNVAVARIRLVVRDNTARLDLETAEKVLGANLTEAVDWTYTSTVALPDESLNHQVDITVAAYDLAGNEVTSTVSARP